MLKVLVKKQLLELNNFYFVNRKTGKKRTAAGVVGMILLFLVVFLSVSSMFVGFSFMLSDILESEQTSWIYFSVFGMLALVLGIFGSVFNTYAGMYKAMDNDLLLSMPLKSSDILISRVVGVFVMSLFYSSLVWLPGVLTPVFLGKLGGNLIVISLLLTPFIGLLVSVLTCALGYLIALISSKLRNKSYVVTCISVVVFFGYYYVCMKLNTVLSSLIVYADRVGKGIKTFAYPLFLLGRACMQNYLELAGFVVLSMALSFLCYEVLSRSFAKIVTANRGEEKHVYVEQQAKTQSVSKALLKRELKLFISNTTYCMNTGLGVPMMLIACVVLLIKAPMLRTVMETIPQNLEIVRKMIPLFVPASVIAITSMDGVTAPSVSLEGKNIWIVQSLPVNPIDILKAKESLHVLINFIPATLTVFVMGYVFNLEISQIILSVVLVFICIYLIADFGLVCNLLNPIMNWTSEVVPVKQSFSVLFVILAGLLLSCVIPAGFYFLSGSLEIESYTSLCIALLAVLYRLENKWLRTKGSEIFSGL